MRATKAYIASLGTTGVLLAASILMLAVVSAVVAFDRWPNGNVSTRVQTLVIDESPAAIRVTERSSAPSATTPAPTPGAGAPARAGGPTVTTAPVRRVAVDEVGTREPAADGPGSAAPGVPNVPDAVREARPIIDAVSNPDTTAGRVADGTKTLTDGVAGGVGKVSPELGGVVAGTGEVAAQTLRDVPLPDNLSAG